jgi:hypothetical protein
VARLKIGLQNLRESGELKRLVDRPTSFITPSLLALAAGVAALVIGIGLWRSNTTPAQPGLLVASVSYLLDHNGHSLSVGGTQALFRKRAGAYDATIEMPPEGTAIQLRVLPDTTAGATDYRASLLRIHPDDSEEPLGSVTGLHVAQDGFVDIYTDASRLTPGKYRLKLEASGGSAAADIFTIQMMAPRNR